MILSAEKNRFNESSMLVRDAPHSVEDMLTKNISGEF